MSVRVAFFEDIEIRAAGGEVGYSICGQSGERVDFVVMRGYDERLSRFFSLTGATVINRWEAMALSHDKLLTHICLTQSGLPTPDCFSTASPVDYDTVARRFGAGRFIVKQIDGSRGSNVFLVDSPESFADAVGACGPMPLYQKAVESSFGRDLRLWIIGGTVGGCVLRQSSSDFRSNYSLGGTATLFNPPPEAAALAVAAARATGLFFAGVDLLFDGDGFTVCEVNGNAGFRSLSAVGGPDLPDLFFKKINTLSSCSN